jgi:hypothetical protein
MCGAALPVSDQLTEEKNIVRKFRIALLLYVALDLLAGYAGLFPGASMAAAQTALTQTTLASAVNGPAGSGYSGISTGNISGDTNVFLTAVTGISAPLLPGTPVSYIYVNHEAMGVLAVSSSLKMVTVMRASLGTQASPHVTGANVLISNVYSATSAFGANPLPSGFFQGDPPYGGACTAANVPTAPWVNVITGAQWVCSTLTGTWAPSWDNPLSNPASWIQTATVASAASAITPSGPYFNISGTAAITGFNIPIGFDTTEGGCFTANPTGIWTWTAAGNIATAGTTTAASTPVTFCWNVASAKWIPSRLA